MDNRPITTLFMLTSVDGKISTGNSKELDFDVDFPKINGVKDTASLINGKSIEKVEELDLLGTLKLEECKQLKDSYIQLKYKVINNA